MIRALLEAGEHQLLHTWFRSEYNCAVYLVDGNNVMGQRVGWHRDKPAAEKRLIEELSAWNRKESETVTVVFDGSPLEGINDGETVDGVQIYFAHPGSDADERIVELSEKTDDRRKIVAVTSDRRLSERLRLLGVKTIRSGQFRKMLEADA